MRWVSEDRWKDRVLAREFAVPRAGSEVPGMLWTPMQLSGRRPLVLIGHGGSQSKNAPGIVEIAIRFVEELGFAAAAIDGPIHGARRTDGGMTGPSVQQEFRDMWESDTRIDFMVAEWQATIDRLLQMDMIDSASIGWYGVSMGTAYGLPLVAAEPRIRAAVLGMWGANYPNSHRLVENAPAVRCPTLFQMKWDDQFFTRTGQLDLFDGLGSADKWCKIYPGEHTPVEGVQQDDIVAFLAHALSGREGHPS